MKSNFWEEKTLSQMSADEWDMLCDGCGRCCLNKLEDEDTGEIYYTNVACRLLDIETCRCTDYKNRFVRMEECIKVEITESTNLAELPDTCAYRLLASGKKLHSWHPLLSEVQNSVHKAGISVKNKVVSEEFIHPDQLEEHIISWEPAMINKL